MSADPSQALQAAFAAHRALLWGMSYRMLGVSSEADEVVQDTFVRALERPPRQDAPLRPWLVRVAMNLSRDRLRARRVRGYTGTWLPAPVEELPAQSASAEARYGALESLTVAFLAACEVLTPAQRAVLLLRDVYGLTVSQTAEALSMSPANVKTTLHRARRLLADYESWRVSDIALRQGMVQSALMTVLGCLSSNDIDGLTALISDDAVAFSDSAGRYTAARVPIQGAAKIARFYAGLARQRAAIPRLVRLSGLPAVELTFPDAPEGWAPRALLCLDVAADGRVCRIFSVMAPDKVRP
jgi:RNA polymerase sigma factor (sigma-70 family)